MVKLEPLVVLYGKSGLGKSSLLNAAIIPRALSDGYFAAARIRFNAWQQDTEVQSPLTKTWEILRHEAEKGDATGFLDKLLPNEASLWYEVKKFHLSKGGKKGILLIFDQFEELFTYPADQVLDFRRQLAEALFTPVPQRYWDVLENNEENLGDLLTPAELAVFQQPPDVKVVLAIRSDRMHLLHQLNDYFPTILKNCYELGPLDEQQAAEAIERPASLSGEFFSPAFTYQPLALAKILFFLTDGKQQKIESTQLQIICNYIEEKVRRHQLNEIQEQHVSDLEAVIENYYDEKIEAIASAGQQLAARRLIEEGLLFEEEERRLSMYEGQIYRVFDIESETLRELVDSHLLRAEPSLQGGYTYELSHDSLVSPVLKAKKKRLEQERQAAELRARAEQERALAIERRKRMRARLVAVAMTILAALSMVATLIAVRQSRVAAIKENDARLALNKLQVEKLQKEKLQVQRLLDGAETYIAFAEWDLAFRLLQEARQIDSTNAEVNDRIEVLKQRLQKK